MEFPIFLFFIIIMVLVIFFSLFQKTRTDHSWKKMANDLGLNFSSGGLFTNRSISGAYEGYTVRMWTYSEGGKHKTYYTAVRVQLTDVSVGLELKKDGFLRSIGTFLGGQDIEVGADAFDRNVIVKGYDRSEIRSYLTQERMTKLIRFFRSYPYSEITQSKLDAIKQGTIKSSTRLKSMLKQAVRLARLLEGKQTEEEQQSEERIQKGRQAQNEGNLPEARKRYDRILETEPNNAEALSQKANVEYMDHNYSAAAALYKEALRWEPNDPMIRKNYKRAAEKAGASPDDIQNVFEKFDIVPEDEEQSLPADRQETSVGETKTNVPEVEPTQDTPSDSPPSPTAETKEPNVSSDGERDDSTPSPGNDPIDVGSEPPSTAGNPDQSEEASDQTTPPEPDSLHPETPETESKPESLTKEEVIRNMFNPRSTGVEAGKRFEKTYEGKTVTWSAPFIEDKDLSLSLKFTSREGDLMKVLLHRGSRGTDVKRNCYGFVHVLDGLPENLEKGDTVQFQGTLFRLDEFMRNLYISDATLQTD